MIILKVIILFLIFFFSIFMGHSQQIYHKNLLGTWDLTDTTHGKMAFQFIDSTHSIILTERPQIIVKSIGTYKLDQKDNIVELIITGDTSIISKKQKSDTTFSKNTSRFLMKLVDLNIFKLQIDMSNTGQWAPEEQNNTGTYIKRKIVY